MNYLRVFSTLIAALLLAHIPNAIAAEPLTGRTIVVASSDSAAPERPFPARPTPPFMSFTPAIRSGCPCVVGGDPACCDQFRIDPSSKPFTIVDPAGNELFKYEPK